jgi:hypothetical protein
MNKRNKIIYLVATIMISLFMLFGASMYFVNYDLTAAKFQELGFPIFMVYPLAIAKLLGLVAIWSDKSEVLRDFAYAGYTFTFLMAAGAHLNANDGGAPAPLIALTLLMISYVFGRKMRMEAQPAVV